MFMFSLIPLNPIQLVHNLNGIYWKDSINIQTKVGNLTQIEFQN